MVKVIQLGNVPDALYRTLKARAALAGMSLSDFLVREIRKSAERPTAAELSERLEGRRAVRTRTSSAAALRAERNVRDRR